MPPSCTYHIFQLDAPHPISSQFYQQKHPVPSRCMHAKTKTPSTCMNNQWTTSPWKMTGLDLCKAIHCTGRILANTRSHQLCWDNQEMGTAMHTDSLHFNAYFWSYVYYSAYIICCWVEEEWLHSSLQKDKSYKPQISGLVSKTHPLFPPFSTLY